MTRCRSDAAPLVPAGSAPDDAASDLIGLTRRSVVERQATVERQFEQLSGDSSSVFPGETKFFWGGSILSLGISYESMISR